MWAFTKRQIDVIFFWYWDLASSLYFWEFSSIFFIAIFHRSFSVTDTGIFSSFLCFATDISADRYFSQSVVAMKSDMEGISSLSLYFLNIATHHWGILPSLRYRSFFSRFLSTYLFLPLPFSLFISLLSASRSEGGTIGHFRFRVSSSESFSISSESVFLRQFLQASSFSCLHCQSVSQTEYTSF